MANKDIADAVCMGDYCCWYENDDDTPQDVKWIWASTALEAAKIFFKRYGYKWGSHCCVIPRKLICTFELGDIEINQRGGF